MRLNNFEVQSITKVFEKYMTNQQGQLFLFGSRADDHKKGGDIDLYVLLKSDSDVTKMKPSKSKISYEIQGLIGEQRIDITINSVESVKNDAFWQSIQPELILLREW